MGKVFKKIKRAAEYGDPRKQRKMLKPFVKRRMDKPFERPDKTLATLPGDIGRLGRKTTREIGINPRKSESERKGKSLLRNNKGG